VWPRACCAPEGGSLAGRNLEDFAADDTSDALDLMVSGHLDAYEGRRTIHRGDRTIPVTAFDRIDLITLEVHAEQGASPEVGFPMESMG
jgi:hypothetical protein